ncbi:MAG: hypothetical protein ACMXX8_02115, partial [Candidatus Woesearchaeota archaeon]
MIGPISNGIENTIYEKIPLLSNEIINNGNIVTEASVVAVENTTNVVSNLTNVATDIAINASNVTNSTLSTGIFGYEITGTSLALVGAAVAVGAAGIASAIGAGITGATGARAVAEDPKNFSTALLFQALPQTQGIYGFLISILILLGAGVIGASGDITLAQGLGALGAGLAVGIAAISAIGQGIASSSAIGTVSQDRKLFGKSILFSVLPETQALYGFIISILILIGIGLFGGGVTDLPMV